jgi:hypothetical protein
MRGESGMRVVNEWNLGLYRFVSAEKEGRYALSKVAIREDHTAATDGRAMVKVDFPQREEDIPRDVVSEVGELNSDAEFVIDADLCQRLARRVSTCRRHPVDQEQTMSGVAYVATNDDEEVRSLFVIPGEDADALDTVATRSTARKYPNVNKVIPEDEPLATVDINGNLLGEILKYLGEFAHFDANLVTLSLHKEKDKDCVGMVKIEATNKETGQKAVGVVMPFAPKDGGE